MTSVKRYHHHILGFSKVQFQVSPSLSFTREGCSDIMAKTKKEKGGNTGENVTGDLNDW